ncbi:MAG: hypothetical protein JWM98_1088 [Thermoleophilia bacterium]|nr:hypothetical protein [Thermoleophilia bacterium]
MKMLPVRPVETLATIRTAAPAPSRNPGIVPPWLQGGGNDGIVPPWLQATPAPARTAAPGRNPGIVPPWLQGLPVGPDTPVGDDVPRILAATQPTGFDPSPVDVDVKAFPRAFSV